MHSLTAIAAFAATMFMLSVVTSVMTEMWHRMRRSRLNGLRKMLEKLYVHSIEPRMVPASGVTLTADQFASLILENRAANDVALTDSTAERPKRLNELEHISEEVFAQKLADLALKPTDPNADLDAIVTDISAKFVTFGSEMSVVFERNARLVSIVCALILAFVAYVHPYGIAKAYLLDEDLARKVADIGSSLEAEISTIEENADALAQQQNQTAAVLDEQVSKLNDALEKLNAKMEIVKATGVPIGWPAASAPCSTYLSMVENCSRNGFTVPSIMNILWLAFGGLLVGLGAPFWKQIIDGLTRSGLLARQLGAVVETTGNIARPAAAGAARAGTPVTPASLSLKTYVTAVEAGKVKERNPPAAAT